MTVFRLAESKIDLVDSVDTFKPNFTTKCIASAMRSYCAGATVLDLGCGVGVLAIAAAKFGATRVLACEISEEACRAALENTKLNEVDQIVSVCQSDLYPINLDEKFDLLVCDVSGVANTIAEFSGWFPGNTPAGGPRGSEATVEAIKLAPNFLNPNGHFLFPLLSLADRDQTLLAATSVFGNSLRQLLKEEVPFSPELYRNAETMDRLAQQGIVSFVEFGGRRFWTLEVWIGKLEMAKPDGVDSIS